MKGLLTKDFYLLMSQKKFLAALLIFCLIFGGLDFGQDGLLFAYVWGSTVTIIVSLSTINMDRQNNSFPFLFTLPFSRKMYVWEKFLLSWIGPTLIFVLFSVCGLVRGILSVDLFGVSFIILLLQVTMMSCVEIPLLIAVGPDKSGIVVMVLFAAVSGFLYGFLEGFPMQGSFTFLSLSIPAWILLTLILCAVLILLASKAAEGILKKKDL